MATSLNVTPAGNNLFQVEVQDSRPETTNHTSFEVSVPDGFVDDLALEEGAATQDVVLEAVRFVLDRTDDPDQIDGRLDLYELAEQYPGFTESLGRAVDRGQGSAPTDQQHTATRSQQSSDERLVEETRQAQADGNATPGQERF